MGTNTEEIWNPNSSASRNSTQWEFEHKYVLVRTAPVARLHSSLTTHVRQTLYRYIRKKKEKKEMWMKKMKNQIKLLKSVISIALHYSVLNDMILASHITLPIYVECTYIAIFPCITFSYVPDTVCVCVCVCVCLWYHTNITLSLGKKSLVKFCWV